MPEIVIIAGPNGAGKTSFATEYLVGERAHWPFVNADEIVAGMTRLPAIRPEFEAGRVMLQQAAKLVDAQADFALETTLACWAIPKKFRSGRRVDTSLNLFICDYRAWSVRSRG